MKGVLYEKVLARIYVEYLAISTKYKIIMTALCNFHDPDKCTKLWVNYIGEALAKSVGHGLCSYADAAKLYDECCEKMEQFKNMIYRM